MTSRNPPSVRVLTRPPLVPSPYTTPAPASVPPPPSPSADPPPPPQPSSSSSSLPSPCRGVVVVGFICRNPDCSPQLINRVLDLNAFGSGNLDTALLVDGDEAREWFRHRKISHYYEEERGILYLLFCSHCCPPGSEAGSGFDSVSEAREFGDLKGMLFMFSVCHIIVHIQDGSHFDTQTLKNFRILQAAKHALAPFVRSQTASLLPSRPQSSPSSRAASSTAYANNISPGRSGIMNRNASAISLMSGIGSYASLFPGQCTPVILFVFVDDYLEGTNTNSHAEEAADTSSLNVAANFSNSSRPALHAKGGSAVVVLARPVNKSEGGLKKKLQSSLEAQIRFLIKKCRILSGSETNHSGLRGGGASTSAPLFLLDTSRAVVLLDRSATQNGESLEFAIGLVEDVLNGKATSDSLLLESHSQSTNREDIISIKEFICRQSDLLRGRGGLVANANSGSAAGVGMVAVAAAAAAASAASGKPFTAPELPSLESWLSSSQIILHGILSGKRGCIEEIEVNKRKPRQRNINSAQVEGVASRGAEPVDVSVSWLERGKGLHNKFSTSWCQKALPSAKEVYLKELPAIYSTSQHETHLAKALHAFRSLVRGPAVQQFTKILEDECVSIWKSGRQQCDAVSLTGKPCVHERHTVEVGNSLLENAKPHSSGYVFLHACACGRSRQLRPDPFDFESANTMNYFSDCEKLLPALQLPEISNRGPVNASSWSLLCIGSSKYYEPSRGLLQSGFCSTEKFLLKWTIFLGKQKTMNGLPPKTFQLDNIDTSVTNARVNFGLANNAKKNVNVKLPSGDVQPGNVTSDNKTISFGTGLPNYVMKRPFSEVVAGTSAANSGFPPLQEKKPPTLVSENVINHTRAIDVVPEQIQASGHHDVSIKVQGTSIQGTSNKIGSNKLLMGDPFLQIGSNIVPVNMNAGEKISADTSLKSVTAYLGFEYECPHGHRFLLNQKHLNELGPLYSSRNDSNIPSPNVTSSYSQLGENSGHPKVPPGSDRIAATRKKGKHMNRAKEILVNGNLMDNQSRHLPGKGKEYSQTSSGLTGGPVLMEDLEEHLRSISFDDSGYASSLLNRKLPIYMNCPHCQYSKKTSSSNVKFAGTFSQLQRIFLVTPPFPFVLATDPVIQFEASCLPLSIPNPEQKLQFSLGHRVVLPPESFLVLRLPFIYGIQLEDQSLLPLSPFEHRPECTAWITEGTALLLLSKESGLNEGLDIVE